MPEPDNPVDNAIAFKCKVGSKWCKFGYAVREVTNELKSALSTNSIANVQFRYVCSWTRSTPGYYAAIHITKNGTWSNTVTRSASTF